MSRKVNFSFAIPARTNHRVRIISNHTMRWFIKRLRDSLVINVQGNFTAIINCKCIFEVIIFAFPQWGQSLTIFHFFNIIFFYSNTKSLQNIGFQNIQMTLHNDFGLIVLIVYNELFTGCNNEKQIHFIDFLNQLYFLLFYVNSFFDIGSGEQLTGCCKF